MKNVRITLAIIVLLSHISMVIAENCDFELVPLIENLNSSDFSFKMKAVKFAGAASNTSLTIEIIDSKKEIVKEYHPWTNTKITKQKTSNSYSPNLEPGTYKPVAQLAVGCEDTVSNNLISSDFKVEGEVKEVKKEGLSESTPPEKIATNYNNVVNLNPRFQGNLVPPSETEYLSSSEKSKKFIVPFLLFASVLMNIVLIWKR